MAEFGYNQANIAVGGTAPYTYSLASGSLPAGTVLKSDGTVEGTATTPGPFNYTIKVTDSSVPPKSETATISGTITPVVSGTASFSVAGATGSYNLPPYNTLKVEIFGTATNPTTVAQMGQIPADIGLSAGGGGPLYATVTWSVNIVGAPLNYSIGASGGTIKITWS